MYCRKCGAEIPNNAKFCTKCGTKVEKNDSGRENKANDIKLDLGSEFDFFDEHDNDGLAESEVKKESKLLSALKSIFASRGEKSRGKKDKKNKKDKKSKSKKDKKSTEKKTKKKPVKKKSSKKPAKKTAKKPTKKTKTEKKVKIKAAKKPKKEKLTKEEKKARKEARKEEKKSRKEEKKARKDQIDVESKKKKRASRLKLIIILIIVLLLLGGAGTFAYIMFGDQLFADAKAKKILFDSAKSYFIEYEDIYEFPSDYITDDEGYLHREYKFEISEAYGGLINEDVLSTLEGIKIEMDSTRAFQGNDAYQIISIKNKNDDEIRFNLINDENHFKVDLGEFYDKTLLVSHNLEEGQVFSAAHNEVIAKRDLWFYTIKSLDDVKYTFSSPFTDFIKNMIDGTSFSIGDKDENGEVISYKANLSSAVLLENMKLFLSQVDSDANVNTILSDIRYFAVQSEELKKTDLASANMIQDYITDIDNALVAESLSSIDIELKLDENYKLHEILLHTVISNLDTNLKLLMNDTDNKQELQMNLEFSRDNTGIGIEYVRNTNLNGSEDDISFERNNSYKLSTSYDDIVTEFILDGKELYTPKSGIYKKTYKFDAGDFFDRLRLSYTESGTYAKEETERVFEKDIQIDYDTIFYDYYIKLDGSMKKNKVEAMGSMKDSAIENLDYISSEDYDAIKDIINDNIDIFLNKFSTGEW